jgi:hypothetical protein
MAESQVFTFSFKELATLMIKEKGLKEGLWGIYVRFGLSAGNLEVAQEQQPTDPVTASKSLAPAAIIPLIEVGLQRFESASSLTVDAAEVWQK